jgi:ATP adenylyltransferase
VLREWERTSKEPGTNKLFAFFNCGSESGASQSHRHIQFLPNASMQEGMEVSDSGNAGWENLTNTIAEQGPKGTLPELPFEYFGGAIPPETDDYNLYQAYKSLIKKAGDALAEHTFSYNLSMTTSAMILVPRRHDKYPVLISEEYPSGFPDRERKGWELALNGTILAGTLMVKDKDLYEYLKTEKDQAFDRVLARVCFPFKYSNKGQEVEKSEPTRL